MNGEQEKQSDYTALVEFVVGENCEFFEPDVRGGFGRCHICAVSERHAKERIEASMKGDDLGLVGFEWCVLNDGVDWDPPLRAEDLKNIRDAQQTGELVWSWFDVYGASSDFAQG